MRQLIINADDLGICRSTNRAIAAAFRHGVLTSTSLMACGPAFEDALEHVVRPNPDLGVGLHVCLTSLSARLPASDIPLLVDRRGEFRHGFASLLRLTLTKRRESAEQIEREVAAQFEVLEKHGVSIDHVDSHRHVHMIPAVFEIVARVARRYGCPAIRVSHEPFPRLTFLLRPSRLPQLPANLAKKLVLSALARSNRRQAAGLFTPDRVAGVLNSGQMDRESLETAVRSATDGVTEIITHPGELPLDPDSRVARMDRAFLHSPARQVELRALLQPALGERIERAGCRLARYSDCVAPRPQSALTAATT